MVNINKAFQIILKVKKCCLHECGLKTSAANIRFTLCPGDVVLVLLCFLFTLVLGRQRSAIYFGHNVNL